MSLEQKRNDNGVYAGFISENRKSIFVAFEYFKRLQRKQHSKSIMDKQWCCMFCPIRSYVLQKCKLDAKSLQHIIINTSRTRFLASQRCSVVHSADPST